MEKEELSLEEIDEKENIKELEKEEEKEEEELEKELVSTGNLKPKEEYNSNDEEEEFEDFDEFKKEEE